MPMHMEQAAPRELSGQIKQIRAAASGLSGVFKTLMQEHSEASALLMRLKERSEPELRRRLFPLIRKELLGHERAELSVIYPLFAQHPETVELAIHHNREAHSLEAIIERLHVMDVESEGWEATFDELVAVVQKHVSEEESHFFPAGEYTFGRAKAIELEHRYLATKHELIARL